MAPTSTRGDPAVDSFSDLDDLDAEIDALARDLGRASDSVRPVTSFDAGKAMWSPFRIGRYTALRRIGAGGMGVVYAAYDDELDRKVAIKIVRRIAEDDAPEATARMRREAQALAKLSHPNVLAVHEVGVHDNAGTRSEGGAPAAAGRFVFIVMEFVAGTTLRAWWTETPRSRREILDALVQAGRGLAAVHRAGLVHRDVKPENVMIGDDGRVRLMDFGLARATFDERVHTQDGTHSDPMATPALSHSGALVGTPAYMAPEQFDAAEVGPLADQFAFGVMAWEAFFGERPFAGETLEKLRGSLVKGERREPPRSRAVPRSIRRALERAVAIEPTARFPDLEAMLRAMTREGRPRWWAIALPIAAVGVVAAAAPRGASCDDRELELGGIWDDARRERVREAVLATGVPYAQDTWTRVEQRLDAAADGWMTAFTAACERRESSLSDALRTAQALCLAERKRALAASIGLLADADASTVEHAVELVSGLPDATACGDVSRLASEVPLPADPEVAARVDALRERLSHVVAMLAAGAYRSAAPVAEAIVADARALDHPPVLAAALLRSGQLDEALAAYPVAEIHLREAYAVAIAAGDDRTAAAAAVDLVRLVGHRLARHEAGIEWGFHAGGIVHRLGDDGPEASRLENLGAVRLDAGEAEAALDDYLAALAVHEQRDRDGDVSIAVALDGLGRVYRSLGDYDAAMTNLSRALELRERFLSPMHPAVGGTHVAMAAVCIMRIDHDGAREHYRRALEIYEAALGPDHPNVATALDGLGFVHTQSGEPALALPLHRRALEIRERALVPNHPEIATSLGYLGQAELDLGHLAAARDAFERSLAALERVHGGDHPQIASRLTTIADTYVAEGDETQARALYERGLAMKERTVGAAHPGYAVTLFEIGGTYLRQGQLDEAMDANRRSLVILEKALGEDHPDVGNILRVIGTVHELRGEHEQAVVAFERALKLVAPTDMPAPILAELRFELAKALWAAGTDRPRAVALAREAQSVLAVAAPTGELTRELAAWLDTHAA